MPQNGQKGPFERFADRSGRFLHVSRCCWRIPKNAQTDRFQEGKAFADRAFSAPFAGPDEFANNIYPESTPYAPERRLKKGWIIILTDKIFPVRNNRGLRYTSTSQPVW